MNEKLKEKINEALSSVLPITVIVAMICFFITPVSSSLVIMFLVGALLLILGMGFFSLGADMSMSKIGERIGANLSKSKKVWIIAFIAFLLGTITTIAEPDLQVLATQINEVPNLVLVGTVGFGVGIFLAIALLRIVLKIKLSRLLLFFYFIIACVSFFVPKEFLPIAFDSGGVTTGPMTVPFILALGIGAASIRGDKNSESDSFGLVALCSVGPIIAVMILGIIYKISGADYTPITVPHVTNTTEIRSVFQEAFPTYAVEVLESLSPIVVFFYLYNLFRLKLPKQELKKITMGFIYTYIGLVVFMVGVNVGFLPVGNELGTALMNVSGKGLLIAIMFAIGFFIVNAEPAVQVLTKQVNNITDGAVSSNLIKGTLSIGMVIALVVSCLRAWYGISILWFIVPGYLLAIILTFISPEIFTAIAFDSGGVTSGPMTASFLLPLMIGMCQASGRSNINIMQDAFGLVAMVAMMPLITLQLVGVAYKYRTKLKISFDSDEAKSEDDIIIFKVKEI